MSDYVYTMSRVNKIVDPKKEILKDISLSFFPGAKIGVLGLNGSGKSSLLRIMAGIDKDFQGEAFPQKDLKIGYLPQEPTFDESKTVREVVEEAVFEVKNVFITCCQCACANFFKIFFLFFFYIKIFTILTFQKFC